VGSPLELVRCLRQTIATCTNENCSSYVMALVIRTTKLTFDLCRLKWIHESSLAISAQGGPSATGEFDAATRIRIMFTPACVHSVVGVYPSDTPTPCEIEL
jgi:hypothetical protein